MDEEEIKIKMDDGSARFFTRFGGGFSFSFSFLTCETQNEIVVS